MKKLISSFLLICGTMLAAPTEDGLYATLQTTMGDVCFELYCTNVPRTVANFVSLAEGSRPWIDPRNSFISNKPYYDGIIFHRVINGFMIQAGSPKGDGTDGPGYTFEDEFNPALRHDRPGVVSMANSGPDSNGGQFFITVAAYPDGNDKYSVFGRVVEGMSIVSNIAAVATDTNDHPLVDITITNVFITRNGTNAQHFAVTNQSLPEVMSLPISITSGNGIKLSTETATSSYQYVYASTNLTGWEEAASQYWPEPAGNWVLTASGEPREFFHAARVVYPADKNRTANPVGHQLIMTIDGDTLSITAGETNSGVLAVSTSPVCNITYWQWDAEPYRVRLWLESDDYAPFFFELHYTTPTNGNCIGGQFYDGSWHYIGGGEGTFTDQNLN
jgi:peptidyl-prolyl cis-trans isomerase A (cyclophilin A)